MNNSLTCVCGAPFEGDGYTLVYHCPFTDIDTSVAPDSNPIYCDYNETAVDDKNENEPAFKRVTSLLPWLEQGSLDTTR